MNINSKLYFYPQFLGGCDISDFIPSLSFSTLNWSITDIEFSDEMRVDTDIFKETSYFLQGKLLAGRDSDENMEESFFRHEGDGYEEPDAAVEGRDEHSPELSIPSSQSLQQAPADASSELQQTGVLVMQNLADSINVPESILM